MIDGSNNHHHHSTSLFPVRDLAISIKDFSMNHIHVLFYSQCQTPQDSNSIKVYIKCAQICPEQSTWLFSISGPIMRNNAQRSILFASICLVFGYTSHIVRFIELFQRICHHVSNVNSQLLDFECF